MHKQTKQESRLPPTNGAPTNGMGPDVLPMQNNGLVEFQERQMELQSAMQQQYMQLQAKQQMMATVFQQAFANPNTVVGQAMSLMDEDVNEVSVEETVVFYLEE